LAGQRQASVISRRTKLDFAMQMKDLVDEHYPDAKKIALVMDNLNTHRMICQSEAFTPAEARRIIETIEVVRTPKHRSRLNSAECELSVLEKQCLGDRIGDEATLRELVRICDEDRDHRSRKIDWQFETAEARIKLRRLQPQNHKERTTSPGCCAQPHIATDGPRKCAGLLSTQNRPSTSEDILRSHPLSVDSAI
jgi:hypothetical protein